MCDEFLMYQLLNSNYRNRGWLQRRKERGRIAVESVHVVETASLGSGSTGSGGGGGVGDAAGGGDAGSGSGGIPSGLPFQVGYREAGQEYTLYLLAAREQDRAEWIRAIRAGKFSSFYFFIFVLLVSSFHFPLSLLPPSSPRIDIQCGFAQILRSCFLREARCVLSPCHCDISITYGVCWTH